MFAEDGEDDVVLESVKVGHLFFIFDNLGLTYPAFQLRKDEIRLMYNILSLYILEITGR